MKTLSDAYTAEIRDELSYLATWFPDDQVALGDLGVLEGQRFVRQSTITAALGLDIGQQRVVQQGDLTYHSRKAVEVSAKLQGAAPDPGAGLAQADAGLVVRFGKANAIVLEMRDRFAVSIEDQIGLGRAIVTAWARGDWKPDWCVVVEVVGAASTTLLVAAEADARIELLASGSVGGGGLSLVQAGARFERVRNQNVGIEMVASTDATPLIKALRLKSGFWNRDPKVVEAGLEALGPEDPLGEPQTGEELFELLGED